MAISYCMSPNELRLLRRYDTSVFASRNDGSQGFSTSAFVRVSWAADALVCPLITFDTPFKRADREVCRARRTM